MANCNEDERLLLNIIDSRSDETDGRFSKFTSATVAVDKRSAVLFRRRFKKFCGSLKYITRKATITRTMMTPKMTPAMMAPVFDCSEVLSLDLSG